MFVAHEHHGAGDAGIGKHRRVMAGPARDLFVRQAERLRSMPQTPDPFCIHGRRRRFQPAVEGELHATLLGHEITFGTEQIVEAFEGLLALAAYLEAERDFSRNARDRMFRGSGQDIVNVTILTVPTNGLLLRAERRMAPRLKNHLFRGERSSRSSGCAISVTRSRMSAFFGNGASAVVPSFSRAVQAYSTSPSISIMHSLQALALMQEKRKASEGSWSRRTMRKPSSTDCPCSNSIAKVSTRGVASG